MNEPEILETVVDRGDHPGDQVLDKLTPAGLDRKRLGEAAHLTPVRCDGHRLVGEEHPAAGDEMGDRRRLAGVALGGEQDRQTVFARRRGVQVQPTRVGIEGAQVDGGHQAHEHGVERTHRLVVEPRPVERPTQLAVVVPQSQQHEDARDLTVGRRREIVEQ